MRRKVLYSLFLCAYLSVCGLLLTPGVLQAAQSDDAKAALKEAMNAQLKVKSYRVNMTIVSEKGTSTRTIEFVAPDRMHIMDEKAEIVVVPEGTYQKVDNGKWQKSSMDLRGAVAKLRKPEVADTLLNNAQVGLIGPDTLDGKSMMIYEIIYSKLKTKSRTWIGTEDHLPYKSESESETGPSVKIKTTSLYTYNIPINIVAPIP